MKSLNFAALDSSLPTLSTILPSVGWSWASIFSSHVAGITFPVTIFYKCQYQGLLPFISSLMKINLVLEALFLLMTKPKSYQLCEFEGFCLSEACISRFSCFVFCPKFCPQVWPLILAKQGGWFGWWLPLDWVCCWWSWPSVLLAVVKISEELTVRPCWLGSSSDWYCWFSMIQSHCSFHC